jgi:hypothetical protein
VIDFEKAKKLLALATDSGASAEERRTASVFVCRWMKETQFFENMQKLLDCSEAMLNWLRANRTSLNRRGARIPMDL